MQGKRGWGEASRTTDGAPEVLRRRRPEVLPAATPRDLGRNGTSVGGGGDGRRISKAVLVVGEGQDGEAGEAALRRIRDERAPSLDPSAGGGGVREPGVIGGKDHIFLPLEAGEGGTGSEADEVVNAGDSASRVRPRVRGVRAVVLAALQEGAVCARCDDRADPTLWEGGG